MQPRAALPAVQIRSGCGSDADFAVKIHFRRFFPSVNCRNKKSDYLCTCIGGLAQLARALAWHARGHEFDSRILHYCEQGVAKYCDPLFFSFLQTIRTRIDNHTTLNRKYNPHGSWRSRSVSSGWRAPSSPSRTRRISPPL